MTPLSPHHTPSACWTQLLAHNLAIGAALCHSFDLGYQYADDLDAEYERGEDVDFWSPGCGKAR